MLVQQCWGKANTRRKKNKKETRIFLPPTLTGGKITVGVEALRLLTKKKTSAQTKQKRAKAYQAGEKKLN